jgi:hypothetical protein
MIYLISFVLLVSLTNSALADWTGALSSDWYNAGNWTGAVPTSGETASIDSPTPLTWPIIDGGTADTGQLRIGYTATYQGELTVTGGATLNVNGELRIGRKSNDGSGQAVGILHISGTTTTINVTERIEHGRHGYATIYMSGGYLHCDAELRLAYRFDATSTVYLSGGTIDLGANPGITVYANDGVPDSALIDISGDGKFTLAGNQVSTIETYISDGIIIAYGGEGVVLVSYDGQTDITSVETIGGPDASEPNPADEQADVPRDAVLSWKTGTGADKHDAFFGDNFDDVNQATTTVDPSGVYQGRIDPNIYTLAERLEFGQTYYWRIDEVEADGSTIRKGDVWSFTAELFAYAIENIIATASSSEEGKGPENTVNGSGLDDSGLLHGNESVDNVWLSSKDGAQPTWIEYEFDKAYKLHQMWVWNSNDSLESLVGFGFKDVTIEYSANGADYTTLDTTHEFAQAPGAADYAHNTTVDFGGVAAKYVRLTANSNWGGIFNQYGISEVRFFYIPIHAREPNPDSGATDVELDLTLSWIAGRQAAPAALVSDQNPPLAGHDVYFSSDEQAVIDGTALVTTVTETSHGPLALDLGTTYYWRIDEVNDAETPATWLGDIWDFTTHEYFVLDDFESYDAGENQIWYTWKDGLGYGMPDAPPYSPGNGTGSAVGNENTASYAEETIVHGGSQSMPYLYDNNLKYSEASMTLSSQRDWTVRGVGELSLWFRGYPSSFSTFTEGPVGTYTMTARSENISGQSDHFHYVYKQLSGPGSIVVKVESATDTSSSAKAGVMIRDTLEADSKHALVFARPDGGIRFRRRTETAGDSTSSVENGLVLPYWVKLERDLSGLTTASHSADGVTFVPINDTNMGSSDTLQMNAPIYIGLALSSNNPEQTCQAVFSELSTTGAVTGQWQSQDIDIPSNDPEPMYVALNDNAVVYHDNPKAAQIDTWTEWNIDLQVFADQGVNLTNVDKIAIGFGDRNPDTSGQAGGSGTMYFDDIRLYPLRPEPEPEPQP